MPDLTDCIEWDGKRWNGYGLLLAKRFGKQIRLAHILAWIDANGRLPEPGQQVRHSCDNRPCVNPDHLLIGSRRDNAQDALQRNRLWQTKVTHCPRGHEYTDDNIYWHSTKAGGWARACKTCNLDQSKAQVAALAITGARDPAEIKRYRTHCPRGHEYTEQNSYYNKAGGRSCRACTLDGPRRRRQEADALVGPVDGGPPPL